MRILLQKQVYPDCASCSADFAAFAFWVKNGQYTLLKVGRLHTKTF